MPPSPAERNALRLTVTLAGTKPPIWRRLPMPETMTLADLHTAIQAAMGWENDHLHEFTINDQDFGDLSQFGEVADECRYTLAWLVRDGVKRFFYRYDFGNDWDHIILVEGRVPLKPGQRCPAGDAGAPQT